VRKRDHTRAQWYPAITNQLRGLVDVAWFPLVQRSDHSRKRESRDDLSAKFWLDPVGLARNLGFSAREVNTLQSIVQANQKGLLEAWDGYFGSRG
jgi:hypothetical protein